MKKILFVNAYSARNLGDYAIVLGMKHVIDAITDDAEVTVLSSYHEDNQNIYSDELKSDNSLWNISSGSLIKKYAEGIILFIHACLFPKSEKYKIYHDSDLICSVGGGYLYSSGRGPMGAGLLNMLFHIWLGKRLGKKVVCFPQSVGPINYKLDRLVISYVLSKVDLFVSREKFTTTYLKETIPGVAILEIPDVAFALEPGVPYFKREDFKEYDLVVGVSVLDYRFARRGNDLTIDRYLSKIAEFISLLSSELKVYTIIFPQVNVQEGDSDLQVSNLLKGKLESDSEVFCFPSRLDPEKTMATYGETDIFVGSRMHSTIFAMRAGCNTIGLAYQPKTFGTFALLNNEDNVFDIDQFTVDSLKNRVIHSKDEADVRGRIHRKMMDFKTSLSHII
ncbi:polysaccharide pyruvyl transferase family protein [Marinobacterium sp. xm-d-564]|uniref:polysaccharide pyruvyl transferase family protein n=1 Tax=Marinobacterium sp. xm-d-564 TaxID=2497742 RepID=UPI0015682F5D|nr:polysaccharide pyruvyl transferase family protein [Marinobacterium sp. xm-d-564]NRP59896.1 colanic acid biosynthesis protein [Marinobacterium sp. xm-d-564]